MRKLFLVLVAIFLMASSVYAWVETADNGPENITTCYAKGTGVMTSGNVVILQTSSPTYAGKEVTGTTIQGSAIYGVVVDGNTYTGNDMIGGKFIRVQTYGYCPIINTTTASSGAGSTIAAGDGLSTSATPFRAALNGATGGRVTGSVVAFQAQSSGQAGGTVTGFIKGGL